MNKWCDELKHYQSWRVWERIFKYCKHSYSKLKCHWANCATNFFIFHPSVFCWKQSSINVVLILRQLTFVDRRALLKWIPWTLDDFVMNNVKGNLDGWVSLAKVFGLFTPKHVLISYTWKVCLHEIIVSENIVQK